MLPSSSFPAISRRTALKSAALAGTAVLTPKITVAQTNPTTAATTPATSPTTAAVGLTPDDIATADRIVGRPEAPLAQRTYLAQSLPNRRPQLIAIRKAVLSLPDSSPHSLPIHPAAPTAPNTFAFPSTPLPAYDGNPESLAFATIATLAPLLRAKQVTSLQLTQLALSRLKKHDPALHCVITLTEDLALAQARRADTELAQGTDRGPLHGIPYGLKDLFAVLNYATTCGISPLRNHIINQPSAIYSKLEAAGAVLCAKLSLGELAMGDIWFGGKTRTPWNPELGASGSSAGSCSVVAAGLLPFAIGTETLGSILAPCAVNGTVGLRPTLGSISRTGGMALSYTMDKPGPITRSSLDAAAVFACLAGQDPADPITLSCPPFSFNPNVNLKTLKIGLLTIQPATQTTATQPTTSSSHLAAALEIFRTTLGLTLHPITLPNNPLASSIANILIVTEGAASLSSLTTTGKMAELVQQGPGSWPRAFAGAEHIPAPDYLRALRLREQLRAEYDQAFGDFDIILHGTFQHLAPFNLTGHPTLLTRIGLSSKNEPQMLALTARPHLEPALLALAHAFESATTHLSHWPRL